MGVFTPNALKPSGLGAIGSTLATLGKLKGTKHCKAKYIYIYRYI